MIEENLILKDQIRWLLFDMVEKGRTLTYQLLPELLTTTEQKIEILVRSPVKERTATETKSPFSQIKQHGKNQGQDKDPSDGWGRGR